MTTIGPYNKHKFKGFLADRDKEIPLNWIKGLLEQIEFANRYDVLRDYVIEIRIRTHENMWR